MSQHPGGLSRRQLLRGAAAVGAGVGFIGNWRWARAQAKKPIVIGLTCDATGTFADSGQADRRGMILAIEEQNARGGVVPSSTGGRTPRPTPRSRSGRPSG
jgi:branched-chain amino acid transport system substrate-binding protein